MSDTDPDKKPLAPNTDEEPDTYDLAFDPEEDTPAPPVPPVPLQTDGSDSVPSTGSPSPATLPEPPSHYIDDPRAGNVQTPDADSQRGTTKPSQYPEHVEPEAVSPAKAEARREEQRVCAAMEQAEAEAKKKKLIITAAAALAGLLVLVWLLT